LQIRTVEDQLDRIIAPPLPLDSQDLGCELVHNYAHREHNKYTLGS
jgi:hypothetical protein